MVLVAYTLTLYKTHRLSLPQISCFNPHTDKNTRWATTTHKAPISNTGIIHIRVEHSNVVLLKKNPYVFFFTQAFNAFPRVTTTSYDLLFNPNPIRNPVAGNERNTTS